MENKKRLTVLKRTLVIIGIIVLTVALMPLTFASCIYFLSPNPPKPEVRYGEFPFELVYEVDGEIKTVKDVFVCKYDGYGANEGVGKYRKWKGYIKSTGDEDLFIKKVDGKKIYCSIGLPEYYMNDPEYYENYAAESPQPGFYSIEAFMSGKLSSGMDDEELSQYNIRLISYKFSDPITNSFK